MNNDHHTHISAEHNLWNLKLKEVWQYKDLIFLMTERRYRVSYKQTVLGPLWLFINPLMTSIVYVVLFGNIAKLSTDGAPQMLFYLTGTAMWTYFSSCVSENAATFLQNAWLFGKVYFPRLVMPISTVLGSLMRFFIQMILVLVLLVFYVITGDVSPNWLAWLLIPLVLVQVGILGSGFGIIISSFTTKYRDLQNLVSYGVQLLMYATPVVYPMSTIHAHWLKVILTINPMTVPMEVFRYAVLGVGTIEWLSVSISIAMTLVIGLFGIIVFNKVERNFIDVI